MTSCHDPLDGLGCNCISESGRGLLDVRREVGELLHLANLHRFVVRKRTAQRPFHRLFL